VLTPIFREGVNKDTNLLYGGKERGIFVGDQVDTDLRWLANQGELQPDITRDETERLVLFYTLRGLKGNASVLKWLIGRDPTSVDEWVKSQLER
jgi:hypothetical protein